MADDKHLPYDAEPPDVAGPDPPPVVPPIWTTPPDRGAIEFRRKFYPFAMGGGFDRSNGNRFTKPIKFRSDQFFKAIPTILGFSTTTGAPAGGLSRRLPIHDEEGLGMVAVRIPSYKFVGTSKIKPGAGNVSRIADDVNAPEDPAGPKDAGGNPLARTWVDDAYTAPDVFNFAQADFASIKQTRYCIANVEFYHPPFPIFSDRHVRSAGNTFGANDERYRYMWSDFVPSIEWVTSKAITLKFGAGATGGLANQPCGTEAGFARPTGELVVHWEKVPANAVALLFSRFEDTGPVVAPAVRGPRYSTINQASFDVPLFGTVMTYAAETLMFMGCRPELRFQCHGILEFDLHYHFNYRFGGWNNVLTGRSSTLQPVVRQDGSDVYQKSDFSELFKWA